MRHLQLLLAALATGQAASCVGDGCCSLNGIYDGAADTCSCFRPWAGQNCSELQMISSSKIQGYGVAPNVTSWGGNQLLVDGVYHLWVAEMALGCGLNMWQQNSQCIHATASTATGPFIKQSVAVPIWCHNPQVMQVKNGNDTIYALFHIGNGDGGDPKNCSASEMEADAVLEQAGGGSTVHLATSPYGPWTPSTGAPESCNNPAPLLHSNGTLFVVCDDANLVSAPSIHGPWTPVTNVHQGSGGVPGNYEDAFLFIDPRGHWHILWHVYTLNVTPTCVNSTVSGHYFSLDGLEWTQSPFEPYSNLVTYTDGSSEVVPTRERPKLFFNADGDPSHLINGVTGGASQCLPTPCVNCKTQYWDFTLVQPLAV